MLFCSCPSCLHAGFKWHLYSKAPCRVSDGHSDLCQGKAQGGYSYHLPLARRNTECSESPSLLEEEEKLFQRPAQRPGLFKGAQGGRSWLHSPSIITGGPLTTNRCYYLVWVASLWKDWGAEICTVWWAPGQGRVWSVPPDEELGRLPRYGNTDTTVEYLS